MCWFVEDIYGRGGSVPFDFEPNGIPFGSNLKGKRHHDHIPLNLQGNANVFFSVYTLIQWPYSPEGAHPYPVAIFSGGWTPRAPKILLGTHN